MSSPVQARYGYRVPRERLSRTALEQAFVRERHAGMTAFDPWNIAHDHAASGIGSTFPYAASFLDRERTRIRAAAGMPVYGRRRRRLIVYD